MPQDTKFALNAGELSDELSGRPDLGKFQMGCSLLENATVLRVGGVTRRAGLMFGDLTHSQTGKSRIQGFGFSSEQGVVLEFSDREMSVFKNNVRIAGPYVTPWTEDQIFSLQFSQRIDRIIVSHGEVELQSIFRNTDTDWIISPFPWQQRLFEDPDLDGAIVTLTPSGVTGDVSMTSSADVFSADWVGQRLSLTHTQSEQVFSGSTPSSSASGTPAIYPTVVIVEPVSIKGVWSFETSGTWEGTYKIERSYDDGTTFSEIRTLSSDDDKNFIVTEEEEFDAGAIYRVTFSGPQGAEYVLTISAVNVSGEALITTVTSSTVVQTTVEKALISVEPTSQWQEEAFSPRNGYPKTSTFHQSRLVLGGSEARPQSVYTSRTRRPFDFTQGTGADDGMNFEVDSDGYESVVWIVSHLSLVVGTTSGVWAISAPDGRSLTPENSVSNKQVKKAGFEGIPAVHVDENILFLQRRGRKIHELTGGSVEYGGYSSVDLTQLSTQVTRKGVTQMTSGEIPDSALYLVSGDELSVLTYERPQNVIGWSRWKTDGKFESVATCPGDGENDDVYVVVNRNGVRSVEMLSPDMLRKEESGKTTELNFLDSSVVKSSTDGFTTMDGLDHLNGRIVTIFADGELHGETLVEGGQIELSKSFTRVVVGLKYATLIRPMPIDFGALGSKSAIYDLILRIRNSLGGKVSQDGVRFSKIDFSQSRLENNESPDLHTGDFLATPHSTWKRGTSITLKQEDPLPMTLLAMRIKSRNN